MMAKIIAAVIGSAALTGVVYEVQPNNQVSQTQINPASDSPTENKLELNIYHSLFKVFAHENDYVIDNGARIWNHAEFELKPELADLYDEIGVTNHPQNTIVIIPVFTAMAYSDHGFYSYYKKECDTSCLTVNIADDPTSYHSSENGIKILKLLGYSFITDIDIDKNPNILSKYDKVILLHSEYVTKNEFDAITSHPNVIYLYPNSLFAEIKADYDPNTITLIRGHYYPDKEIANGFGWKFDNTNYEEDKECKNMFFYKIDNGYMLNCFPVNMIYKGKLLLKQIKDF